MEINIALDFNIQMSIVIAVVITLLSYSKDR
jgi:hypothetical protein